MYIVPIPHLLSKPSVPPERPRPHDPADPLDLLTPWQDDRVEVDGALAARPVDGRKEVAHAIA